MEAALQGPPPAFPEISQFTLVARAVSLYVCVFLPCSRQLSWASLNHAMAPGHHFAYAFDKVGGGAVILSAVRWPITPGKNHAKCSRAPVPWSMLAIPCSYPPIFLALPPHPPLLVVLPIPHYSPSDSSRSPRPGLT